MLKPSPVLKMMSKIQIIVSLELENIDLLAASELDSTRKLIVEFE